MTDKPTEDDYAKARAYADRMGWDPAAWANLCKGYADGIAHGRAQGEAELVAARKERNEWHAKSCNLQAEVRVLEAERDTLRAALADALPYLDEHVGCEIQENAPGCYDVTRKLRTLLTHREPTSQPEIKVSADAVWVAPREPDTTAGPPTETPETETMKVVICSAEYIENVERLARERLTNMRCAIGREIRRRMDAAGSPAVEDALHSLDNWLADSGRTAALLAEAAHQKGETDGD